MMKKQAFILTLPITNNFGCALQAFALGSILKRKGFKVIIINKMWDEGNKIKQIFSKTIGFKPGVLKIINRQKYYFHTFLKKYFDISQPIFGLRDLQALSITKKDLVVFGSDQIWNPKVAPGLAYYFGSFIKGSVIKKIAYAASFGCKSPHFSNQEKKEFKDLLKDFYKVTVRETEAVKICQKMFQIKPKVVLDPSLLCKKKRFLELVDTKKQTNTFLKILLQKNNHADTLVDTVIQLLKTEKASKEKMTIQTMFHGNLSFPVEEFVKKIHNCQFVLTDSYHGMLFSIIFNKSFLVIPSMRIGGCSSRITTVLNMLRLEGRFLKPTSALPNKIIIPTNKWENVNKKIKNQQAMCLKLF